jgi:uncharacterized membrane protein
VCGSKEAVMHKLMKTIEIKAPAQRVYDFLAQPMNLPSIWPSMVSVSNVVARQNGASDFDWVYKMAGMHFKGHSKVLEAQPGKVLRIGSEGGIPSTFRWSFEGLDGSATRLTCEVEYTIPTPLLGRIAEAIVAKLNEREMEAVLANLKDVTESAAAGAATAAARPH